MKQQQFIPAVIAIGLLFTLASCSSGRQTVRHYPPPPPPPGASVSLIITGGPGYVINRGPRGRYYYRNPQGLVYWRGANNRYYLDNRYMQRSYHRHPQYNDWNRYHRRR